MVSPFYQKSSDFCPSRWLTSKINTDISNGLFCRIRRATEANKGRGTGQLLLDMGVNLLRREASPFTT